jgi:proline dehydrogenase
MPAPNVTPFSIDLDNTEVAFASRSPFELWKMKWMFSIMNQPAWNNLAVKSLLKSIEWHLPVKSMVKKTIFQQFCGGETMDECLETVERLSKFHVGTILDYSVEGEKTEAGFEKVQSEVLATINIAASRADIPFAVFKTSGIASVEILEKVQAGKELNADESISLENARKRFGRICGTAAEKKVRVFVDAEESWIQDVIDAWCYEEMALYNQDTALIYNTFQLYRQDILARMQEAVEIGKKSGYLIGAKLVRGAYMEKEAAYASANQTTNPIHRSKEGTDADFNKAWRFGLENLEVFHFCCGSHNEASNRSLAQEMVERGISRNDPRIWFAQLLGMSDNISFSLAREGFNVAKYVPFGPVLAVMPYLVRRAAENTSVAGQTSRELNLIQKEIRRRNASA